MKSGDSWVRGAFVLLALVTIGVGARLLHKNELGATDAAILVGLAGVFVLFASRGSRIIDHISKIGPGGIELTAVVVNHISKIPALQKAQFPDDRAVNLTPEQQWGYEVGTDLVLHFYHQALDVDGMSSKELREYRETILKVGQFALVAQEYSCRKALYLVSGLEDIPAKTAAESYLLGETYRLAYMAGEERDKSLLDEAIGYLEESTRLEPRRAKSHYSLAWVYGEAGRHPKAIIEDNKTLEMAGLDTDLRNGTNWNAACSYVALKRLDEAMECLRAITPEEDWSGIWDDPELAPLRSSNCLADFESLKNDRLASAKTEVGRPQMA
jgi:hypothetical protein